MAAVREAREKVPALLTHLGYQPRDTFNLDETALWLSVLPRKTYSNARIPGRKISKERLTVAFLVNADGSHVFRPLVISKAHRPHDFRPDYDPEAVCYWWHNAKGWMTSALNAAMYAEGREIAVLLDNASSHMLRDECAWSEIVCGMRTTRLSNVRLNFLPPNTTAFTHPLDQGIIATAKARYRQHWLRAFTALWNDDGATSAVARYRPNLRDVLGWLSDAWMSVGARTIQRCFWRTGCMPLSWSLELTHVYDDEPTPPAYPDIELADDIDDVGELIGGLGLGTGAMTAAEYVAIDEGEPTCAEAAAGATPDDADVGLAELWRAPTKMQAVYDESDPIGSEARRTARAASEMLIGYARAVSVTPRDLCHLFDIRNPIIRERMERASPALNLNTAPPPRLSPTVTPPPDTPRPRGRVLPGWMTQPSRRQQLLDAGVGAAMGGYVEAAEWMHVVVLWIALSFSVIIFNKYILDSRLLNWPFPISLTMIHMAFCSSLAFLLVNVFRVVQPLPGGLKPDIYLTSVVPIGALYALSLWFSNSAYMYLSVSFIQMLKALMPVAVYLLAVAFRKDAFRAATFANMILIAIGVAVSAWSEANFNATGVLLQLAAVAFEATRLVLIQMLLTAKGISLNPITSLYYISPVCLLFLSVPWFLVEFPTLVPAMAAGAHPSVLVFGANCVCAFALNLAVFLLIGKTSALTMNVAGIIKDWLLIAFSWSVIADRITTLNLLGYLLAFAGVCWYNRVKMHEMNAKEAAAKQAQQTDEETGLLEAPREAQK
ncbi:unnamed protein product [Closterium sp. NIES-65]|nr:unnamed protein product [Closterium sp. NIES-65]